MVAIEEGTLLWQPSEEQIARSNLANYQRWLEHTQGLHFDSYDDLWRWSVTDLDAFWASIWDYFQVEASKPYTQVLGTRAMPGAEWFPGAELNYAAHLLRRRDDHPAVLFKSESRPLRTLTFAELARQTASVAAGLRRMGVRRGDRVVGYLPNIPEALIGLLATASLGAIWSCCPPEFGTASVIDRFRQIEPRVLIAVDGYQYNGRPFDRTGVLSDLLQALPTVETTILVPYLADDPSFSSDRPVVRWESLLSEPAELAIEPVPFDHPLWILYSSGTTDLPKAIVHGHGGTLLEQLKSLAFHLDLTPDDRFFWFTTTGWMMWNKMVSALTLGTTIVLYDGSPAYPDLSALWQLAEEAQITNLGAGAPFHMSCLRAGLRPGEQLDLHALRAIGSTGAPLPPEGYQWVYDAVKRDVHLGSSSGGTDLCTAFVGPCPILPVHAGELQTRALGAKVEAFDPEGRSVIDEVGELVLTEPLPSMPLHFWNDPDGTRYRESYFEMYPGVWRHGDWIKINPRGSCVIYGRSDATLNRGGVRMGTSEFYRVVESFPEVVDSLVVDTSHLGVQGRLLLFVVLREGRELDEDLKSRLHRALAQQLSPRHVPDAVHAIDAVPRTLNGKKVEVPVKRILQGVPVDQTISRDALANPASLDFFAKLA